MDVDLTVADLPTPALVAIGVLGVVQLALDVVALVDLVRRPRERVATGNKWLWVAVILLVNTIGAILYLALGRRPAPAVEVVPAPGAAGAASVADALYGPRPGSAGAPHPATAAPSHPTPSAPSHPEPNAPSHPEPSAPSYPEPSAPSHLEPGEAPRPAGPEDDGGATR